MASDDSVTLDPLADLPSFCRHLARNVGAPPHAVDGAAHLVADLRLREFSLFALVAELQRLNPHFALPDQMQIDDVTVRDLYHYVTVMSANHRHGSIARPR
jgi:hypothetical protein